MGRRENKFSVHKNSVPLSSKCASGHRAALAFLLYKSLHRLASLDLGSIEVVG